MARVQILPEQVANQIAAGEVVERPASVVKELVENALDAGAARIAIALEGGGADLIRVADDGCGMSREDAELAIERHATSKVRVADDLKTIASFGFRGEALPSIASVSRLDLTTSTAGADEATLIRIEAGRLLGVEPASHPRGTTVEIRGLFHNAPARRKFLRSRGTESAHAANVVARIAAAHPAVAFELVFGGRQQASWPAVASYRERVAQIVGREIAAQLIPVDRRAGRTRVRGLTSRPGLHRSTTRDELLFVNGRPIRDRRLQHAVHQAYATLLPKGRFPVAHLFLDVPADEVDVNVHPAKAEVRFLHGGALHDLVREALLAALGISMPFQALSGSPLARTGEGPAQIAEPAAAYPADLADNAPPSEVADRDFSAPAEDRDRTISDDRSIITADLPLETSGLTPLAQYHDTYIVAAAPDGLVVVDQHAAHERVLYERLLGDAGAGRVAQQALLFPASVEVSGAQRQSMEEIGDLFQNLGFSMLPFGPTEVRIDAIPALLENVAADRLVREMLDEVLEWGRAESVDRIRSRIAATAACHSAVRANQTLLLPQMTRIVTDLMRAKRPMTCPHGRPTILRIPLARLEREFGRR